MLSLLLVVAIGDTRRRSLRATVAAAPEWNIIVAIAGPGNGWLSTGDGRTIKMDGAGSGTGQQERCGWAWIGRRSSAATCRATYLAIVKVVCSST